MSRKHVEGPQGCKGLEPPASLELDHMLLDGVALGRLRWRDDEQGIPVQLEQSDGYMLCYHRNRLSAPLHWVDGKAVETQALDSGQFLLLDLRHRHASIHRGRVDCISVFLSQAAMADFHREHGLPPFASLRITAGAGHCDPIVHHLVECFVHAFEKPETVSRLFLDQLARCLMAHLTHAYGEPGASLGPMKGRLASWQERRAKALLLANLCGNISLEALARECGLSRAHFSRAFKASTGQSPMAWLLCQRLQRARQLLAESTLTLAEIAHGCGFADQSHFSRVFTRHAGVAPGQWRRQKKR